MHASYDFLRDLALVLCVAAVTTVLFQRLRQPVVFGYLLAGMLVGPHLPFPLTASETTVRTLSELGVILLMFGLGLEFNLRRLIQVFPTAGIVAVLQGSAMIWFGYITGRMLGWTQLESVYAGAAIAVSSTTIIVKAFAEQRAKGRFTELVFGILIIEDLIAIFLLAMLTTLSSGTGFSASTLGVTATRLFTFLVGLLGAGLLVIPRLVRAVVKLDRPETTLVASIGICFAAALLALWFGYSVALGAFIAGSLVAESGEGTIIEPLVAPVRDMFAAIFFVAVGMMIDPVLIAQHWGAVLIFTLVVIIGNVLIVTLGTFLTGFGTRTAIQVGMSLAQIGEFSFIIAGLGLMTGAVRPFFYPIAVAVSAITTLITPWLIRAAPATAAYVDRKLPKPLQTFTALYASWIERVRSAPADPTPRSAVRRFTRLIVIDAVLLAVVMIGTALEVDRVVPLVTGATRLLPATARLGLYAVAATFAAPLLVGLIRSARSLGMALAMRALPKAASHEIRMVDTAAAPRRAMVITLQVAILCFVGIPLVAVTQPFLPLLRGGVVLLVILAILSIAFWKSATNLHGHARAGAEIIVSTLAQHMAPQHALGSSATGLDTVQPVQAQHLLPGLGEPVRVQIRPGTLADGKTLTQLNLRGLTGATVLAITRGEERVVLPVGREALHAGDVLALAGTQEAVEAAMAVLRET